MAYILRQMFNFYRYYMIDYSDERSDNLPIVNSAITVISIVATYLYIVLSLGPRLMEKRQPFRIKNILIVYNTLQIVSNLAVCFIVIKTTYWQGNFSLLCNDSSGRDDLSEMSRNYVKITYLYFLLKILDLFDTIFFLLRKRFTHITFLHVYHHSLMVLGVYIATRFLPAGHATMLGILNCMVHCLMYGYYLVSALNENVARSIWWKKYITQIQLIQFSMLTIHFMMGLFATKCTYPKSISFTMVIQNLFMLFMFGDFYIKAYFKGRSKFQ